VRKETFLRGVEEFQGKIVKALMRSNVTKEHVTDAVQNMVVSQMANKTYAKFEGDKVDGQLFSYLRRAAKWQLMDSAKRAEFENETFLAIDDADSDSNDTQEIADRERIVVDATTCPFCHEGELNHYKACGKCRTILGQGRSVRVPMSIEEADLASMPDYDLRLDVFDAMNGLTDLERKVIERCAVGNDTLDDLAELTQIGRDSLWRIYVKAKRKLQTSLAEYA
jgi:DNA-directed RNA polymerase specialized sigma24 family protein